MANENGGVVCTKCGWCGYTIGCSYTYGQLTCPACNYAVIQVFHPSSAASRGEPGGKIDPENPSTVPESFRPAMIAAAEVLAARAVHQPGGAYTTPDGVLQMLTDLLALARNDGCVAAAWAFEQLVKPEPGTVGEWMTMETAPKDDRFLAVVDGHVRIVKWGKTSNLNLFGFCLADQGVEGFDRCNPVCWMPLPLPPAQQVKS